MSHQSKLTLLLVASLALFVAASSVGAEPINTRFVGPTVITEGQNAGFSVVVYHPDLGWPADYHLNGGHLDLALTGADSSFLGGSHSVVPHEVESHGFSTGVVFNQPGTARLILTGSVWAHYHFIHPNLGNHEHSIFDLHEVTVLNVNPSILSISVPSTVTVGQNFFFSVHATDVGGPQDLTYTWDFGVSTLFSSSGIASLGSPGIHHGTLRVDDPYGGFASQQFAITALAPPPPPPPPPSQPIPEPSSVVLLGLCGAAGLLWYRRKHR